jgi:WD40 repeat protein
MSAAVSPQLDALLADVNSLSGPALVSRVLTDLRARWYLGQAQPVERYLERFPALATDAQAIRQLAQAEWQLRTELGPPPTEAEFRQRFPQLVDGQTISLPPVLVAQPETLPPAGPIDPELPITVPGYEILGELGRGGIGVVYQARDLKLNRLVALKMILAGSHASSQDRERFLTEAAAVAALQHPNIVQIHEIGESAGLPYMALEYLDGGSLHGRLAAGLMRPAEAAALVERLARAMQTAHAHAIVHRDLKPHNVLLAVPPGVAPASVPLTQCVPKITDFGLAKRVAAQPEVSTGEPGAFGEPGALATGGLTVTGAILGTPSYMAPEQARGQGKRVGPAADIYALGAILYECLTGVPPFRGPTPMDTMIRVLEDEAPPVRQLQPKVARDLETICMKCLHKDPARRYASAEALADDLRRFQDGEPIAARPVGRGERAVKWVQRRPATAALLVVSVLGILAMLAGSLWFTARLAEERDTAVKAQNLAHETAIREADARQKVEEEKGNTDRELKRAERLLYISKIQMAHREWQNAHVQAAIDRLDECRPELCSWEHSYLRRLCLGIPTFRGHTAYVTSVAFRPDGKHIASGSQDRTIQIWDAATGQRIRTLPGHANLVTSVAYSPDGRQIASGCQDATVRVWDAGSGRLIHPFKGHRSSVTSVAFSRDGRQIISGSYDGTVKIWNATTGQETKTFRKHTGPVTCVAFSPDNQYLASGSLDWTVKVWDVATGQSRNLSGHTDAVQTVAFSPDGQHLASGGFDTTVKVWDVRNLRAILSLKGHTGIITSVAFSPDGKRLASASWDGTIKVWNPTSGEAVMTLIGHTSVIASVAFSPDGQRLASGSHDATVKVWDATRTQEARTLRGHDGGITGVAISRDSQQVVSVCTGWTPTQPRDEATLKIWPLQGGQEGRTLRPPGGLMRGLLGLEEHFLCVTLSPDGKQVLVGSTNKTVRRWDVPTGKELTSLRGHTQPIRGVAVSPDGRRIASAAGEDGKLRPGELLLWDAGTGQKLLDFKGHQGLVSSVAFSSDGRHLASGSWDGTVKVSDAATGLEIRPLAKQNRGITSVAFSPDGKHIITGGFDGTVKLWDAATGRQLLIFKGHSGAVTSVALGADGQRIVSGSYDQTIKVWDVPTGQEVLTLKGHKELVTSVAISKDGKRIVSGSNDKTVKVWEALVAKPSIHLLRMQHRVQHVRRGRGVRVRLHRRRRPPLAQAPHLVRVVEHQPQRHDRLDHPQPALLARQHLRDLGPPGVQVAGHWAEVVVGHRHLQPHHRLQKHHVVAQRLPHGVSTGCLECRLVGLLQIHLGIDQHRLHVHHREAQFARIQRAAHPLLRRGHEQRRQQVGRQAVEHSHRLAPLGGLVGLKLHRQLGEQPTGPRLLDALALDADRPAQRLAVADPRLAHPHLQAKVALHAVLLDLQVQRAHAVHQRLACLRVDPPAEGRVLAAQHVERRLQLRPVGRRLRLDRLADHRLGKLNALQQDRVLRLAQRVAGDRLAQPQHRHDVAGIRLMDILAVPGVGEGVVKLADQLLVVPAGVVDPALRLEYSGIDANVIQLAVRVGHDLEDQAAKWLFRIRFALLFLVLLLGVDPDHRRPVEWAGQVPADGVEQRLNADVLAARTAQHRLDHATDRLGADDLPDRLGRNRLPLQVGAGEAVLVIVARQRVEELFAPGQRVQLQVRGDRLAANGLALVGRVEGEGQHFQEVDDADERRRPVLDRAGADGDDQRHWVALQALADLLDGVLEVGADHIHLVDEDQARHLVLVGLPPDRLRLGLDPLLGVENNDGSVEDAQGALNLGGEIDMAGGVDQVDGALLPRKWDASAVNGDAAFLLLGVVVGFRGALVHAAELVLGPGVVEQVFGGGRLAGVDVRNDPEVADLT